MRNELFATLRGNGRAAAVISSLLVLPLSILEWTFRLGHGEGFPWVLFGVLWLLPFSFVLLLPLVTRPPTSGRTRAFAIRLAAAALLLLIAAFWSGVVVDQMPCFLGVPNCD